ncbi:MAG TPA: V-type ATPase subunit [Epulopiscium sp.]|nr:V-type ATPase subunit [Candidatus Epulonipiscium sp.]
MNHTSRYAAIHSKLKVRKRAFLTPEDYETILTFTTIDQMQVFLKSKIGFREVLKRSTDIDLHRADLEIILHRYEVSEIEKIIYYFSDHYRAFFRTMLMEYEMLDLQLILQTIAKNVDTDQIKNHFVHSIKYSKLNYNTLLEAKTVPEFVESLRGTIYYNSLKTLTQEDAIRREFHMEMKLYILYYKELMAKIERLDPEDCEIGKEIIGTLIDCINIQWIYRGVKYYAISPEEILIYTLGNGRKISYGKLKKLCYAGSIDELKVMAQAYLGYPIFKEEDDSLLGQTIDGYLDAFYMKYDQKDNIGLCIAFLYELALQIKGLISMTECIRYGYSVDIKRKYLVQRR